MSLSIIPSRQINPRENLRPPAERISFFWVAVSGSCSQS